VRLARRYAIAGLAALAFATQAPLFAAPSAPRQHSVSVDGHPLALWETSARKPRAAILLVHGRTWSALPNFDLRVAGESRSVMRALADAGFAVYALDMRGYGATPRDATGWLTPQRARDDVAATLDWIAARHPHLPRPALLGYSRGSQVALLVAQQRPQSISALLLFAFPPGVRAGNAVTPEQPPRQPTTRAAAAEDFITAGAASAEVIEAYVTQAVAANPVRADWREESQFVFEPAKVTAPTLMLYGVNDPLRDTRAAEFFNGLAAVDRAFVILPASDHAAHVENSHAAFVHEIVSFLTTPRAPN
jgi:alpha-beta hydrolase superfamily lysophospholipase